MNLITLILTGGAMFIFVYVAEVSRGTNHVAYRIAFTGVLMCSVYLFLPATRQFK